MITFCYYLQFCHKLYVCFVGFVIFSSMDFKKVTVGKNKFFKISFTGVK